MMPAVHSRLSWIAVAFLAAACPDGGGSAIDGAADAPMVDPAAFDGPEDFDPLGCEPGSFAGVTVEGVRHQDVTLDLFGSFPLAIRFEADGAHFGARSTQDVRLTDDHLFVRLTYEVQGMPRIRTYYACAVQDDGSFTGKVAYCQNGECLTGTFVSVKVERIPGETEASGLELVSEHNQWPDQATNEITVNVRVKDGIAYVARYVDGLRIIDVSDATTPVELGHAPVALPDDGEIYNDVKLVGDHALMASSERGVVVIDVSQPGSPIERTTFGVQPDGADHVNVHTLFVEGTRAYLANTTGVWLEVWDVADATAPVYLGAFQHPEVETNPAAYLHDLYVEDQVAYLNYWDLGFVVVDAADPANMVEIGRYDDYPRRTSHSSWVTTVGAQRIAVVGDEDWGAHLHVVDLATMERIGELSLRPEVSIHNIMAFGDRAYIAWYQDGLRIVDLSDPTLPAVEAWFNTWNGGPGNNFFEGAIGLDVDLATGVIYLADTDRGLLILRPTL